MFALRLSDFRRNFEFTYAEDRAKASIITGLYRELRQEIPALPRPLMRNAFPVGLVKLSLTIGLS